MNYLPKILSIVIFLLFVYLLTNSVSADPGGNGRCSLGGGVYAENTPSTGHEGFGTYCAAGNKAVADTSTEPAPYCWVRTWDDCLRVQGILPAPPIYQPPVYQPPVCLSSGYCSAQPACGQSAVGVDNCGMPCSRTAPACPVVQPIIQPLPAPAAPQQQQATISQTITNTNNNTNTSSSTSQASATSQGSVVTINPTREIIREIPVTREVVRQQTIVRPAVLTQQPQVVKVAGAAEVKELPKTGLPLTGLALAALLPIGLKLRRFHRVQNDTITPQFLREERLSKIS